MLCFSEYCFVEHELDRKVYFSCCLSCLGAVGAIILTKVEADGGY